jgi:hypothetical protein
MSVRAISNILSLSVIAFFQKGASAGGLFDVSTPRW